MKIRNFFSGIASVLQIFPRNSSESVIQRCNRTLLKHGLKPFKRLEKLEKKVKNGTINRKSKIEIEDKWWLED